MEALLQLLSKCFRAYGVSHQGLEYSVFKQINKTVHWLLSEETRE